MHEATTNTTPTSTGSAPGAVGQELLAAIRSALAAAADPAIAAGQQRYMKSTMPYRGLRAPVLRQVVRPLLAAHRLPDRDQWEAAVRALWDGAEFREERYAAEALAADRAYRDYQDPSTLDLYEHLVVSGAWWDHVDVIAIHLIGPIGRAHRLAVDARMRRLGASPDLWLRRTAIIHQIAAKAETDTRLLADVIVANLGDREFFIRKAIGWALREYAKVDATWVRTFVGVHGAAMSGLSRREATKHLG